MIGFTKFKDADTKCDRFFVWGQEVDEKTYAWKFLEAQVKQLRGLL